MSSDYKENIELHRPTLFVPIDDLIPYARNARTHSPAQVAQIAASMVEFGWTNPVLADARGVIAGHGRIAAARSLYAQGKTISLPSGVPIPRGTAPVLDCEGWDDAKRRAYILADNQLALNAGWDLEMLAVEIGDLKADGFDLSLVGFSDDELAKIMGGGGDDAGAANRSLSERFGVPPFSVLNAREGWWQERKASWLALGIRSEIGRGGNLGSMAGAIERREAIKLTERKPGIPGGLAFGEFGEWATGATGGTSIFDPVLCELAYLWFCPPGGIVLDPFAGGSVRGIVAAKLGREYVGFELRAEQVTANRDQAATICADGVTPAWVEGDSAVTIPAADIAADMIFSCPPYGDLEVYSDDASDLSGMTHSGFLAAYRAIIAAAVAKLKPDRFACFVVGDFRDGAGFYRNFVSDTIAAFEGAGAKLYNEAILVTPCGSLPIRAGKQFAASRKLGKTHQNVLVFCKGDPRKATDAIGVVDYAEGKEAA